MKNSPIDKPHKNYYTILIVEDNLILADAIEMIVKLLPQKESILNFYIEKALNYESALIKIKETSKQGFLDVVILDINLGKSKEGDRKSGEELGALIRTLSPSSKIIVFTTYSDGLRINSIIKNVNPEGFLIKDGTTNHNKFQEVIVKIIKGETYYCDTVADVLRRKNKIKQKLDAIDLKLLQELSNATKLKNMFDYFSSTISGVEKRRQRLKEIFEVDSDRNLVLKAKEIGFL